MKFSKLRQLLESYKFSPICEGGAAGHMMHPYDNLELTFHDLREMIKTVFSGNLDITEKTDGQNAQITWKNGKIGLARNMKTIQNPWTIDDLHTKFTAEHVRKTFISALSDLEKAISENLSEDEITDIFMDGTNFINLEIISPTTANVIEYGTKSVIQFHNGVQYDIETKQKLNKNTKNEDLYEKLKSKNALQQDIFEIKGPIYLKFKKGDFSNDIKKFEKDLAEIQGNLSDDSTLEDYYSSKWKEYIDDNYPQFNDEVKQILVNRFVHRDNSVNLIKIKKMQPEYASDIHELTKDPGPEKIQKQFAIKFEKLFLRIGAIFLKNLSGFLAMNPDKEVQRLGKSIEDATTTIMNDPSSNEKIKEKLILEMERLQAIGKENIIPSEGIVFKYNNNVYKFTGAFAPINQILGIFKYGR